MRKSRRFIYNKSTMGERAEIFIAPAITAPTIGSTYASFVQGTAAGEVAVFTSKGAASFSNESTWLVADNTNATPIGTGQKFFVAQRVIQTDGTVRIKRSPTVAFSNILRAQRTLYLKPVRQVTSVGYNGSAGSASNFGTIVAGLEAYIRVIENTTMNQPYPTWEQEWVTVTGDTIQNIFSQLVYYFNALTQPPQNKYGPPVVYAELLLNATGGTTVTASGSWIFTKGSLNVTAPGHNLTAGQYIRVSSTGAATSSSATYLIDAVTTGTLTLHTPFTGVIDSTSNTTETIVVGNVPTYVIALTAITDGGIRFTSVDFGRFFNVALLQSALANATVTNLIAFVNGIGDPDLVAWTEMQGQVADGVSVFNAPFQNDWGVPNSLVSYTLCYNSIEVDCNQQQLSAATPSQQQASIYRIRIWTPVTTASITISPAQTLISGTNVDPTTAANTHHRAINGVLVNPTSTE